jgi:hypothetical protein
MNQLAWIGCGLLWVWSAWQLWNALTAKRTKGRIHGADFAERPIPFFFQTGLYLVIVVVVGWLAWQTFSTDLTIILACASDRKYCP